MNLVRYNPRFRGLGNSMTLLNRLLEDDFDGTLDRESHTAADWAPAVDIREEADQYLLKADLPGVDPANIDITMEKGLLTIQGSRESETTDESNGYTRYECVRGRFLRRFTLPDTADSDQIDATVRNGVLEIRIPKQPQLQPRKIDVKSA